MGITRVRERILFPYSGNTFGGSDVSSLILVKALVARGLDVTVGLHEEGVLSEHLKALDLPWVALPQVVGGSGRVAHRGVWPLREFLRSNEITIVHTNDRRMHVGWLIPARLAGTAHVWHQRTPLTSRRVNLYAGFAKRLVCISEYSRRALSSSNQRRALLLANPIEASATAAAVLEAKKKLVSGALDQGLRVVGFFSNWSERKRPEFFVEVAGRIRAELGPSVKFAMFGEPRAALRNSVMSRVDSLGLKESILVLGQKTPVEPWIAACDLVVAPARNEGFGRVLVEAMQLGTLVVASAHGGHLEIIRDGDNGFLFPVDDLGMAADKSLLALTDGERAKSIRNKAKSEAFEKYSVQAHVEGMVAVYRSI